MSHLPFAAFLYWLYTLNHRTYALNNACNTRCTVESTGVISLTSYPGIKLGVLYCCIVCPYWVVGQTCDIYLKVNIPCYTAMLQGQLISHLLQQISHLLRMHVNIYLEFFFLPLTISYHMKPYIRIYNKYQNLTLFYLKFQLPNKFMRRNF